MSERRFAGSTHNVKISGISALGLTALLPLFIRAAESRHAQPLIRDEKAGEMVAAIDFDFSSLRVPSTMAIPSMLRAKEMDRMVTSYLRRHPRAGVVNIGCGLDTRSSRIDHGEVRWHDLDLPEVIALRRRFISQADSHRLLPSSVMDFEWMEQLDPGAEGWLFTAEGVLMFLPEEDVRKLVIELRRRFPGAELIFDAASRLMVRISRHHPAMRSLGVSMKWGIRTSADLKSWAEGIVLLEDRFIYGRREPRLGWQNIFRFIPPLRRLSLLLHYQLGRSTIIGDAGRP